MLATVTHENHSTSTLRSTGYRARNGCAIDLTGNVLSLSIPSKLTCPKEEMAFFHAAHFSTGSTNHFSQQFLGPAVEDCEQEDEYDGLGCYEDGFRRTLTDEQVAIFRHSEIQTLLRKRRHAEEAKEYEAIEHPQKPTSEVQITTLEAFHSFAAKDGTLGGDHAVKLAAANSEPQTDDQSFNPAAEIGEIEEGEMYDDHILAGLPTPSSSNKKRPSKTAKKAQKAQKAKEKGFFRQHVKPDLRKRTWDKVETGLERLDYDEEAGTAMATSKPSQRRRISYHDD